MASLLASLGEPPYLCETPREETEATPWPWVKFEALGFESKSETRGQPGQTECEPSRGGKLYVQQVCQVFAYYLALKGEGCKCAGFELCHFFLLTFWVWIPGER